MRLRFDDFLLVLAATLLIAQGCGPRGPQEGESPSRPASEADVRTAPKNPASPSKQHAADPVNGKETGKRQPDRRSRLESPRSADEAVRAVLSGIRDNNPRAVWEFLPAGYQHDVNDLVHEFADRMDPALWDGLFTSLKKLVHLLKTQKRFLLDNPKLNAAESINVDDLRANWNGLVGLLETLADSEASDLERLKRLDVGDALDNTGGRLMDQLAALSRLQPENPFQRDVIQRLAEVQVTLASSDGETARVRLSAPNSGEPPQEFDFVKIEGKWIPRTLAEQWTSNMDQAKARLAQLTPEAMARLKHQMLPMLKAVNTTVDALQAATTQAEFDAVVQQQVYPAIESWLSSVQPSIVEPGSTNDRPIRSEGDQSGRPATILVMGRVDADDEEALSRLLRSRSDDPGNDILIGPNVLNGRMEYRLVPVGNLDAFVGKLDFATVIEVDRAKRTITIKLDRPLSKPGSAP